MRGATNSGKKTLYNKVVGNVPLILIGLDNAICGQVLYGMNHIYRNIFQFLYSLRQ